MSKWSILKKIWLARTGLNAAFIMAACSLCFCWLYGVPPLIAGYVALRNLLRFKKGTQSDKKAVVFKLKWGLFMAWAGIGFSLVFTALYMIAWVTGAYIRI